MGGPLFGEAQGKGGENQLYIKGVPWNDFNGEKTTEREGPFRRAFLPPGEKT